MKIRFLFLAVLLSFVTIGSFASVGYVVSIQPGASVERSGKVINLKIKDEVQNNDVLITDDKGRLRIMFSDNGSVNLGSNTRISINDIMPNGKKPKFSANILKGAGRFITGEIVKKNPDGYNIKTPQATIGIRGTIFAVEVAPQEQTKLSVLNSHGQVDFNGQNIQSGQQITSEPGDTPVEITPEEADRISNVTSVPEPEMDTDLVPGQTVNQPTLDENMYDATKNEIADTINGSDLPAGFQGYIYGSLNSDGVVMPGYTVTPDGGGQYFDFYLNLQDGSITNGIMHYSGMVDETESTFRYDLTNGTGTINENNFSINFNDPEAQSVAFPDSELTPGTVTANMTGKALSPGGPYIDVNGQYNAVYKSDTGAQVFKDSGNFDGSGKDINAP